jgi:hypothetical protein
MNYPLHFFITPPRATTRHDNWGGGGGGACSYICVLPDRFLLKLIVFMVCEHEYMNMHTPPPSQLLCFVTALTPPNHNAKQF